MSTHTVPAIIERAGLLLERYDVVFCDVWGVVHNGHTAYEGANRALARFRSQGGTVILVSNAPVPAFRVADMLDSKGVPREAWDEIVSSGAIALDHVAAQGYERVHYIGPRERDAAFFANSSAKPAAIEDAEAVVCTGLTDDINETEESYRALLQDALARKLPFVCANPDLVVDVGGKLYLCAGALADLYQNLGGEVFWAGKPHPSAYGTAHEVAESVREVEVPLKRILAIGDALRTDIQAAHNYGVDALFVASGIHRDDTVVEGQVDEEKLAKLFKPGTPKALFATLELQW